MPRYRSTSSRFGTFSGTLRSPSRSSMKTISRDGRDGSIRWKALRTNDGRRISAIVPRCGNPDGPKPLWKITGRAGSYAATRSASRRASSRGHSSAPAVLPGWESDLSDRPDLDALAIDWVLFLVQPAWPYGLSEFLPRSTVA